MLTEAGPKKAAQSSPQERTAEAHTLRQWAYTVLEEGQLEGVLSRLIDALLITLIVANVAAVGLETVPQIYSRFHASLTSFERVSIAAYTIEYAVRIWSSIEDPRVSARGPIRGRIAFAMRPMMLIDLMAFLPSYFTIFVAIDTRVLRIFRLFRLVKLARYSPALPALLGVLYNERSALFASMILMMSVMCVSAELMYLVEGPVQPNLYGSLPAAMYWAITTLTTVGYGDITPVTPLGRLIAGATMVTGLLLFALPIGIISNGFVTDLHRRQFAITWSMLKRQPLFADFDVNSVSEILDAMSSKLVREHTQIILPGQAAHTLYLIATGEARLEHEGGEYDLGPGDVFGEEALQARSNYERTVTARTEMRLILVQGEDLRRLARKFPMLKQRLSHEVPW
jgi:voltage-gated potassium channel